MDTWHTGKGYELYYKDIIDIIKQHSEAGGSVYIGTDSFLTGKRCVFATAICLHGGNLTGGRYFIQKNKACAKKFKVLLSRIMTEVEKTIYFALKVHEDCPEATIELHLDIGASTAAGATAQYSDMLMGYAKSSGFSCKVKPDSWASSSIADKHSK